MNSFIKKTVFCFALLFFFVCNVDASSFSLYPASGTYSVGDKFVVSVLLKTTDPINAGVGQISFDTTRLSVESIQRSTSLFTLWTEEPAFSNAKGTITFSGGVPNPGFVGVSGNVFRVVFKVKSEGAAIIHFLSGSILANDGKGTNTIEGLGSAEYSFVPAKNIPATPPTPPKQEIKTDIVPIETSDASVTDSVKDEKNLEVPSITTWPSALSIGDILTIHGLGIPQAKVKIGVQKDNEGATFSEIPTGSDGRFVFTYQRPVEKGTYRIAMQNEFEGATSATSEQISVSVLPSPFFQVGSLIFSYFSLVVTLVALLVLVVALLITLFVVYQKWKREESDKISHTENMVHKLFDLLKDGVRGYIGRIEPLTERDIESEISKVEKEVEESIEGMKK